jgi:Flp pilus assembly protein TadG
MRFEVFRNLKNIYSDNGSGVVGFVLVVPLLVGVFIAVAQISMIVADKSVLNSAATIGARAASAADATNLAGYRAAISVLASRGVTFADARVSVSNQRIAGIDYIQVTVVQDIEIQIINKAISLSATSRSVDERNL